MDPAHRGERSDVEIAVRRLRSRATRGRVDAVTAAAVAALGRAGVTSLLLKGPTVADWLYDDPAQRSYVDSDLLVEPSSFDAARSALAEAGFRRVDAPAAWVSPHAENWCRTGEPAVDLHWWIPGTGAPVAAWRALRSGAAEIDVGGARTLALGLTARTLLLPLHAAWHGNESPRAVRDLERAIERLLRADWEAAAALARELDAEDAFAAGLRQIPAGARLADSLSLPPGDAIFPRGGAARILVSISGARRRRERLRALARAAFPSPRYMRWLSPLARRGRAGLAAAYARRLAAGVAELPRALRSARAARRPDGR